MSLETSLDYYADRLPLIYRSKPKARGMVKTFAKQLLADMFALEVSPAYDLDSAIGQQLDVVGKYVGAARDVGVEDTRPYFGYVGYDYPAGSPNLNGFVTYASLAVNSEGQWYEYEFTNKSVTQLSDYSYRQLLKLKIATNFSDNTMESVQAVIQTFFPGQLQLRDNKDMSMTYFYGGTFQLPVSVLQSYLPRPMGVEVEAFAAVAFDVSVDGVPAFNSETPSPFVDFGSVQFSSSRTFKLTNAKANPITIRVVYASNPVFLVGTATPSLPVALALGESVEFTVNASSTEPFSTTTAELVIQLSSSQGTSYFRVRMAVEIEGVFLNWIAFDNFRGYSDGNLDTPWDSWGWAQAGTTIEALLTWARDDFTSYADGDLDAPNAGTDWAAAGVTTYYLNT